MNRAGNESLSRYTSVKVAPQDTMLNMNVTSGPVLDLETPSTHGSPATYEQEVAVSVMIAVFGVWSTSGNLVTILAITTRKYMRTKTNIFIFSLAISDLVSGIVASPLWLYRRTWGFNPWGWGDLACRLYWSTDETTSYCTAMHIASFATWRFVLVKWPHQLARTQVRTLTTWTIALWILSIIFGGVIYSRFFKVIVKPQDGGVYSNWPMCSIDFLHDGIDKYMKYHTTTSTLFMLLPMAILMVMSALISKELFFSRIVKSRRRQLREKKAIAQLALIAASFMIGYIPMTTYMMWSVRVNNKQKEVDYWIGVAVYFCLRFSECMNPIAYNVASGKMRKASREVLCFSRSSPDTCAVREEANTRKDMSGYTDESMALARQIRMKVEATFS